LRLTERRVHVDALLLLLSFFVRSPVLAEIVATPQPGSILEPPAAGERLALFTTHSSPTLSGPGLAAPATPREPHHPPSAQALAVHGPAPASSPSASSPSADGGGLSALAHAAYRSPGAVSDEGEFVHLLPVAVNAIARAVGEGGWHRTLSRSLYASVCVSLQPDFVLQAIPAASSYVGAAVAALYMDARHPLPGAPPAGSCVLLHVPRRECEVLSVDQRSSHRCALVAEGGPYEGILSRRCRASQHVHSTLSMALALSRSGLPHAACLAYVDSRLGELQSRSELMRLYLREQRERVQQQAELRRIRAAPISISPQGGPPQYYDVHFQPEVAPELAPVTASEVAQALGIGDDDVPLLVGMACGDEPELADVVESMNL
jgi:hypothetical protein